MVNGEDDKISDYVDLGGKSCIIFTCVFSRVAVCSARGYSSRGFLNSSC